MPCTGPTIERPKRDAKFVAERLYPRLAESVKAGSTAFSHVYNTERVLKDLFKEVWKVEKPGEGYNYHSYEYNRRKYLLIGYLTAKLPNVDYSYTTSSGFVASGVRIKADNFFFTQEQLEEDLVDLFFIPDAEDF